MGIKWNSPRLAHLDTWEKRAPWCHRGLDKLRRQTNGMRKWNDVGITQVRYNKFPLRVKNRYPYSAGLLSDAHWRDYLEHVFDPAFETFNTAVGLAKIDGRNRPDLDPDFDEDMD